MFGFGVLGFRVQGLVLKVQRGLPGFRICRRLLWAFGCRQDLFDALVLTLQGVGFRVQGLGFRVRVYLGFKAVLRLTALLS